MGGLAGESWESITGSYATGHVSGDSYVGGLMGANWDGGNISSSFSTGSVTGSSVAGGLVGSNEGDIINSYNRGNVIRESESADESFGGFAGDNWNRIECSYSTGSVTYEDADDPADKGFLGTESGTNIYTANFFDNEVSNQNSDATGAASPINTAQMQSYATFFDAGWDFVGEEYNGTDDTRGIDESRAANKGYPFLAWQGFDHQTLPVLTTQAVTAINSITATGNGEITGLGYPNPTQHGVVWSTSENPTLLNNKTEEGAVTETGAFTTEITGLYPNTTYFVRAYATGSAGTVYGEQVQFTTSKQALTITADDKSKVYGETDPALTYEITAGELVGDDDLTGALNRETGEDTGSYDIQQGTLTAGANYDITFEPGTFTITPLGLTSDNYDITFVPGTLTITPKALTVTADDKSKDYGEDDPTFTVSYSGFAFDDNESVVSGLVISRTPCEEPGTYVITPSGATALNYNITFVAGTLTITEPVITDGNLTVTITPPDAVTAGAGWKVSGTDTWLESGHVLNLAPGNYTVTFKAIEGCEKPEDVDVTVISDETASVSRSYTEITGPPVTELMLNSLRVNPGHLYPSFNPEVMDYRVTVVHGVSGIRITPGVSDELAVKVNGEPLPSAGYTDITLEEGYNTVSITVTDSATEQFVTYTLTVLRLPATQQVTGFDAPGLDFNEEETEYEGETTENELTLYFVNYVPGQRIFVNGQEVTPGASEVIPAENETFMVTIPLEPGVNNIIIEIYTDEEEAPLIYQINMIRLASISYGDVNNDGQVTITDAILVLRHFVGIIDLRSEAFPEGAFDRARAVGLGG